MRATVAVATRSPSLFRWSLIGAAVTSAAGIVDGVVLVHCWYSVAWSAATCVLSIIALVMAGRSELWQRVATTPRPPPSPPIGLN